MSKTNQKIIFFDSNCLLCNSSIHFFLNRNKKKNLFFAPLVSKTAEELQISKMDVDSVVYYSAGKIYSHSTAVLKICKELYGPWQFLALLLYLPKFLRDFIYKLVAQNRYRIWGQKEICYLASSEDRQRFYWE